MGKVRFHTLGCKLNFSESSTFARQFTNRGYTICGRDAEADIVVVNSCAVTEQAQRKCRQLLRRIRRVNGDALLVVVGCYAQLSPDELRENEGVQLVVMREDKGRLAELALAKLAGQAREEHSCTRCVDDPYFPAYSFGDRTRAFLKVQDGCNYRCTYCTIPAARGVSRSGTVREVVQAAKELAARGTKEIVLTGVNTGDFGRGSSEGFVDLLRALEGVEGILRYRISSIEPNLLSDEVLDFVRDSQRFLPHFHVPLQSGSGSVLRAMGRRYTPEIYRERIAAARKRLPELFLGVDVIVGFPGESDADFNESVALLRAVEPSYLHVFPFSRRPGTPAATMGGQVNSSTLHNRAKRLGELSGEFHGAYCQRFIGSVRPVLVERVNREGLGEGLTDNYIRVTFEAHSGCRGEVLSVRLLELSEGEAVRGEIV